MKIIIVNKSIYQQYLFDTYLTLTVKDKTNSCFNRPFDIYCQKVFIENSALKIVGIFGISNYGESVDEQKEYDVIAIRPFSYKMESLFSIHHLINADDGCHNAEIKPMLLTFQSGDEFIEMISDGVAVDYFGKWDYKINYSHNSSHPIYNDWRKFLDYGGHLIAIQCLAHSFSVKDRNSDSLRTSVLGCQKEFSFYCNLWERCSSITFKGDRAITCVRSDRDGGFEQTRQEYRAVYSRKFRTKRELITWISDFIKSLVSCLDNTSYINFTLNLDNPIVNQEFKLKFPLKECNLGFSISDFEFFEGMRYIDSNPSF